MAINAQRRSMAGLQAHAQMENAFPIVSLYHVMMNNMNTTAHVSTMIQKTAGHMATDVMKKSSVGKMEAA